MYRHLLTCTLLLAPTVVAQSITLAEGAPSSATIVTLPEANPNGAGAVVLQDVELLPIEITGRYLGLENDASQSRRLVRHGLARVELPDGGRLFRYRRSGGAFWGFLHVAADGAARAVLEQPGVGLADPFEDRVGVARDGSHFAVPLLVGGLYVVRLDGADYVSTGAPNRLVDTGRIMEPLSVMVGASVVWYQSDSLEVLRCGLADGAQPVVVSPPSPPNTRLKDQMAMSGDGSRIVYLYGPDNDTLELFTATDSGGVATTLPPSPSKYEEPGYLPEESGSRALLLDEDGDRLFYIDSDVRDEMFLLDVSGTLPTLHVTDDPIFQPYIGVHILPTMFNDELTVAIGDPNLMDWFRAELTAAGGTVTNLTATGSAVQPFPEGTIDPRGAVPADGELLAVEQAGASLVVRRIDLGTGAAAVQHTDATAAPVRGGATAGIAGDVVVPTATGDRLYVGADLTAPLFVLPPFLAFDPPSSGPLYSAVWFELGNGWGASGFYLPDGTAILGPFENGVDQLCLTPQGGTVIIGSSLRYLAPGVFVQLNRPAVAWRRCLSGAGA